MQIHLLSALKRGKCEEIGIKRAKCGVQRQKSKEFDNFSGSPGALRQSADASAIVPELSGKHYKSMLIIPFSLFESIRDQLCSFVGAHDITNLFFVYLSENS